MTSEVTTQRRYINLIIMIFTSTQNPYPDWMSCMSLRSSFLCTFFPAHNINTMSWSLRFLLRPC